MIESTVIVNYLVESSYSTCLIQNMINGNRNDMFS